MDGLCSNCGSSKHQQCCAYCGTIIRRAAMRAIGFCTRRCQAQQARNDEISMEQELRHMQQAEADCEGETGSDYWDVFGAGGHKE